MLGPLAVTTGFFDGVHLGHAAVLRALKEAARDGGLPTCVVTYDPHPRVVLGKDEGLQLLTCFDEKEQRLASLGIDHLVVIPFTKELAATEPDAFFEQYLIKALNAKKFIVGFDHNIGKNASAGFDKIKTLGDAHGVEALLVQACRQNEVEVSSTKIRSALREGYIAEANAMLGYPYSLKGRVVNGRQIGRQIGFPTANIRPGCALKMLPKSGAYAVSITLDGQPFSGMLNIGTRPTVSSSAQQNAEVHIFDFTQDIYEKYVTITFADRLRDERKMSSLEELKKQLKEDEVKARKILQSM